MVCHLGGTGATCRVCVDGDGPMAKEDDYRRYAAETIDLANLFEYLLDFLPSPAVGAGAHILAGGLSSVRRHQSNVPARNRVPPTRVAADRPESRIRARGLIRALAPRSLVPVAPTLPQIRAGYLRWRKLGWT